jgi:hypothetical protein
MKLFNLVNYKLEISEEAYLIKPFKKLWDRDKSKTKVRALPELVYIFFMEDFRSDYADILNESERSTEVQRSLVLPKGWKEDKLVKDAREFYVERDKAVLALLFLKDAKIGVDKIRKFYREVDLLALDKNGKPIYNISQLAAVIEKSSGILTNLDKLEEMVKKKLQKESAIRGSQKRSVFENGV